MLSSLLQDLTSIKDLGEQHPYSLYPQKSNTTSARGLLPPLEDLKEPDPELLAIALFVLLDKL